MYTYFLQHKRFLCFCHIHSSEKCYSHSGYGLIHGYDAYLMGSSDRSPMGEPLRWLEIVFVGINGKGGDQ